MITNDCSDAKTADPSEPSACPAVDLAERGEQPEPAVGQLWTWGGWAPRRLETLEGRTWGPEAMFAESTIDVSTLRARGTCVGVDTPNGRVMIGEKRERHDYVVTITSVLDVRVRYRIDDAPESTLEGCIMDADLVATWPLVTEDLTTVKPVAAVDHIWRHDQWKPNVVGRVVHVRERDGLVTFDDGACSYRHHLMSNARWSCVGVETPGGRVMVGEKRSSLDRQPEFYGRTVTIERVAKMDWGAIVFSDDKGASYVAEPGVVASWPLVSVADLAEPRAATDAATRAATRAATSAARDAASGQGEPPTPEAIPTRPSESSAPTPAHLAKLRETLMWVTKHPEGREFLRDMLVVLKRHLRNRKDKPDPTPGTRGQPDPALHQVWRLEDKGSFVINKITTYATVDGSAGWMDVDLGWLREHGECVGIDTPNGRVLVGQSRRAPSNWPGNQRATPYRVVAVCAHAAVFLQSTEGPDWTADAAMVATWPLLDCALDPASTAHAKDSPSQADPPSEAIVREHVREHVRERDRRAIDAVLAKDAHEHPVFAVARRAAVLALIDERTGTLPERDRGLLNTLLASLHIYEDRRGGMSGPSAEGIAFARKTPLWERAFAAYERARRFS
jgi:hypothetical protein